MKICSLLFLLFMELYSYEFGRGIELLDVPNKSIKLGAHLSTVYENSLEINDGKELNLDIENFGLMLYGHYNNQLHYLIDIGNEELIRYDISHHYKKINDLNIKRLYLSYDFNDKFKLKLGNFLTPIGLWNPLYINALQWTSLSPFIAENYYPENISGIELSGNIGENQNFEYHLFKELNKNHDNEKSEISSSHFTGVELRYHLNMKSNIAGSISRYKTNDKKERSTLIGMNAQTEINSNAIMTEILYKDTLGVGGQHWSEFSAYLLYAHQLHSQHYLVTRIEEKSRSDMFRTYGFLIGYNYRPIPTLSIKTEGRHTSSSGDNNFVGNEFHLSISVLF